jgi:hypothetical protein
MSQQMSQGDFLGVVIVESTANGEPTVAQS